MTNKPFEKRIQIIGVTGPTGAGKGAVSNILKSVYSLPVLDADKIYHEILSNNEDCKKELISSFGDKIYVNGAIDRRILASVVFANGATEKLLRLNEITHKYVKNEFASRTKSLEDNGVKYAVYDVPLLIESDMNKQCDHIISVLANKDTRLVRIITRDGISEEAALMRIKNQKSDEFYISNSDFVIHNDKTQDELSKEVDLIAKMLGLFKSNRKDDKTEK